MIERRWSGTVQPGRADEYFRHLQEETFPRLRTLAGFVRAQVLRREVTEGVEFRIVTTWDSLHAIRAFAGDDLTAAVVPQAVQDLMVRFDSRAAHYEIVGPRAV